MALLEVSCSLRASTRCPLRRAAAWAGLAFDAALLQGLTMELRAHRKGAPFGLANLVHHSQNPRVITGFHGPSGGMRHIYYRRARGWGQSDGYESGRVASLYSGHVRGEGVTGSGGPETRPGESSMVGDGR